MEKVKQHLNFLLYETIIPLAFLTEGDIDIFQNDPAEYLRSFQNF